MAQSSAGAGVANGSTGEPTPHDYYRHLNQHRFTVELELLSSLASPAYLTNLHAQGYLHQPSFLRYLAHILNTWSAPAYVRFLRFPQALVFGRALVQSPAFREAVGTDGWEQQVTREMIAAWASQHASSSAQAQEVDTAATLLPSVSVMQVSVQDTTQDPSAFPNGQASSTTVKQEIEQ